MSSSRSLAVRATAASGAMAVAFVLAPYLQRPAQPGELPSAMALAGLDPGGPLKQFAFVLLMPFVAALIAGRFVTPTRARVVAGRAGVLANAVLLAPLLIVWFSLLDLFPMLSPPIALAIAAIVIAALRFAIRNPLAFTLTPLAILFQLQWLPRTFAAVTALVVVIVTPPLVARVRNEQLLRRLLALVVLPLFVGAYPLALLGIHSQPHLDFFEDGHSLMPAAEMVRGEDAYTEVVPVHSLLADGGIDAFAMRTDGETLGEVLITRRIISSLNVIAIFAIVLAATGSSGAAFLATMLAFFLFPAATIWIRTIGGLFALAATLAAVRLRSRRWFVAAGALSVVAFFFGMEFAVFSGVVALLAAIRFREVRALAIGVGVASFAALAILGVAWMRVVLFELLAAGRLYVPGPLTMPAPSVSLVMWIVSTLVAAIALARSPLRGSRRDTVWLIALWVALAGLSYAQRRHHYLDYGIPAFTVAALFALRRWRLAVAIAALVVIAVARPHQHLFTIAAPLRLAGGVPSLGNVELPSVPRAHGARIAPPIAASIDVARGFVASRLAPNETFFDFTNSPALYYLFARNCPIRHHQVPFYESEEAQREVIAVLKRDRSVRAALLGFPGGNTDIDGVPNRVRAPLVWQYLQEHFTPAFDEGGVVFWMRAPHPPSAPSPR